MPEIPEAAFLAIGIVATLALLRLAKGVHRLYGRAARGLRTPR